MIHFYHNGVEMSFLFKDCCPDCFVQYALASYFWVGWEGPGYEAKYALTNSVNGISHIP